MGINNVRLHICHHQIIRTGSGTFSFIFFRFGNETLLFIEFFFFCCIGLDLILVLIFFCSGFWVLHENVCFLNFSIFFPILYYRNHKAFPCFLISTFIVFFFFSLTRVLIWKTGFVVDSSPTAKPLSLLKNIWV